jgi:hypothetical protein
LVGAVGKNMQRLLPRESRFGRTMKRRSVRCYWGLKGSIASRGEEKGLFTYRGISENGRPHICGFRGPKG